MSQWMLEPLQNAADEACEEPEGGAWVGAPASRSLQLPRIEMKEFNKKNSLAQHTGSTQVPKEAQPATDL